MTTIRWILAFPVAIASWILLPGLCSLLVPPIVSETNPLEFNWFDAVVLFLTPIVALGALILVLPRGSRSNLVASITSFSLLCVIGTLLVSFAFLIGGGPNPLWTIFVEFAGTIVGARLAYAFVPSKDTTASNESFPVSDYDRVKEEASVFPWILRWILGFPVAAAIWICFPFACMWLFLQITGANMQGAASVIVCFLNPILSLGVLVFILPSANRFGLVACILTFAVVLFLASSSVSILSGLVPEPGERRILELAGTIVGASVACACILSKSRDIKGTICR